MPMTLEEEKALIKLQMRTIKTSLKIYLLRNKWQKLKSIMPSIKPMEIVEKLGGKMTKANRNKVAASNNMLFYNPKQVNPFRRYRINLILF